MSRTDAWPATLIKTRGKYKPSQLRQAIIESQVEGVCSEMVYLATTTWGESVYKIGKTYNTGQRLKALRNTHGVIDLKHIIHCRYSELTELSFHVLFAPYRHLQSQSREMFKLPPHEIQWFCSLSYIHGGHIPQWLSLHSETFDLA